MTNLTNGESFKVRLEPEDTPAALQGFTLTFDYSFALDNLRQSLERMVVGVMRSVHKLPENVTANHLKMLYKDEFEQLTAAAEKGFLEGISHYINPV